MSLMSITSYKFVFSEFVNLIKLMQETCLIDLLDFQSIDISLMTDLSFRN